MIDVADALILRRLFSSLLDKGGVIVATSNRPPKDLYLNGLQRDLFLPFIDLLEEKCTVVSMWKSETDYRLVKSQNSSSINGQLQRQVYFVGDLSMSHFNKMFDELIKGERVVHDTYASTAEGRRVLVPKSSNNVARFHFDDLCRKAVGASDYLAIAERFHTVFVEGIPTLTENDVNVVRRFIVLIE